MGRTALRNDLACATFASATLSGHAKLELHLVKCHAGTRMTHYLPVRHPTANANDHRSEGAVAGCLKKPHYKYEFVAFAIAIDSLPRHRPLGVWAAEAD